MIKHIHPIPAFTDNYIWAIHAAESAQFAVVDPGDADPVFAYAQEHGLQLSHILITHHHPDHTGGLLKLIEKFDPVVFGPEPSKIKGISQHLHEGDNIEFYGQQFAVLEVPGHTLDHIAYYSIDGESPILFCGDTLFAAGCGRLFEGSPPMMVNSLAKLTALGPQTKVYCTHEYTLANLKFAVAANPNNEELLERVAKEQHKRDSDQPTLPSTIALELATNPFLRCTDPDLISQASNHAGTPLSDPTEVFASLRSWKDSF